MLNQTSATESLNASRAAAGAPTLPALVELVDCLSFGIAVVDPQGALIHASRIAKRMLHDRESPLQLRDGLLEATSPNDAAPLQKAIARGCRGQRSALVIGAPQRETDVSVLPLGDLAPPVNHIALMFSQASPTSHLTLFHFARTYKLTRSEECLLRILCDGTPVKEAAAELGCTPNTARTHIRHLLEKTGQPTLRTLTSRVARLPPVAARMA